MATTRRAAVLAGLGLVATLGGCAGSPTQLARQASGAVSQVICTKTFVSGLDPDRIFTDDVSLEPGMNLVDWATRYSIDREHKAVSTRIGGGFQTRSTYAEGRGCTLVDPSYPEAKPFAPLPAPAPALMAEIAGPAVVQPQTLAMRAALDQAFAEAPSGPRRHTEAVLVVKDDQVIAERYAPGFGVDTPLLSRSLAKSVTSALIGILAHDGKIAVDQPAPVAEWSKPGDPRGKITVDQLLRMEAGYGPDDGSGAGAASRLWFLTPDAGKGAVEDQPYTAPGARWAYSSRGYLILARIAEQAIGGGPEGYDRFARKVLFDPLGMHHVTLEFDQAGTPMGAHAMLATARDWAKFGLLYLHDGVVGGQRVLPQGWVAYSTRQTGDAGYGAGFWLNSTNASTFMLNGEWGLPGAPKDAFFAYGYIGQYIVVIPSKRLVIVRFGSSRTPWNDIEGARALVRSVIAATDG